MKLNNWLKRLTLFNNWSINQLTNQPTNQPNLINQSVIQTFTEFDYWQPNNELINQSITDFLPQINERNHVNFEINMQIL